FQISLDGPARMQESRRPAHDQSPTYAVILDNIAELVTCGAEVNIKVILDRENAPLAHELFRDLAQRELLGQVKIAIQHTEAKFAASTYQGRFGSLEEFTRVKLSLLALLADLGYPLSEPAQRPEF